MQKQRKEKLTESQVKLKKLLTPIVEGILNENSKLNEAYIPRAGTYKLELIVENDGSVVLKSNDVGFMILGNIIGLGEAGKAKKYGEYYGQNVRTDFIFFTTDKKELFN